MLKAFGSGGRRGLSSSTPLVNSTAMRGLAKRITIVDSDDLAKWAGSDQRSDEILQILGPTRPCGHRDGHVHPSTGFSILGRWFPRIPHRMCGVRGFGFGDGAQFKDVGGVGALLSGVGGSKISTVCATV